MSRQLQRRRGSRAPHSKSTGAEGELSYNAETHHAVAHDEETTGGFSIARRGLLSAAGGAALTALVQKNSEAATSVQNRISEFISVKDFGAVGDSKIDDYSKFYQAKAATNVIHLTPGDYLIGTSIDLSSVELVFYKGARLLPVSGVTITIGHLKAGLYQIFSGAGSIVFATTVPNSYPEWFGAIQGTADSKSAIQACIDASRTNCIKMTLTQQYSLSGPIYIKSGVDVESDVGSQLNGLPGAVDAVHIVSGNTARGQISLPYIFNFTGTGVSIDGTRVLDVFVNTIHACGIGISLNATAANGSVLDNNVRFIQIHKCGVGIRFYSDKKSNVMQGNYIDGNFISETAKGVLFECHDTSGRCNWDGNRVVIEAIDPTVSNASAMVLHNSHNYDVPRFFMNVNTWCGGLASTAKLIKGDFSQSKFFFSMTQPVTMGMMDWGGSGNTIDTNRKATYRTTAVAAVTTVGLAGFNGGVPLEAMRTKISISPASDWIVGQARVFYIYHLMNLGNELFAKIFPSNEGMGGIICSRILSQNSTENYRYHIELINVSGATITTGTLKYCIFEIGQ